MTLSVYQQLVDDLVRDRDTVITADARDLAIQSAVLRYSNDQPRVVTVMATADAGARVPLPQGWVEDTSELISVEFPIDQDPSSDVSLGDIRVYPDATRRWMQLPRTLNLAQGDELRVVYTAPHTLMGDVDTIRPLYQMAVASLAASILCGQLASYYASESAPSIAADTVDRKDKSTIWRNRARDLASTYTDVMGKPVNDRQKPASVTVHHESRDSLGGRRMFHPTRYWPR